MSNSNNNEELTRLVIAENGTLITYNIGHDIKSNKDIQLWGAFIKAIHHFFSEFLGEHVIEIKTENYLVKLRDGTIPGSAVLSLKKNYSTGKGGVV